MTRRVCLRSMAAIGAVAALSACTSGSPSPSWQPIVLPAAANPVRSLCLPGGIETDTANVLMLDLLLEARPERLLEGARKAEARGELYKALLYSRILTGHEGARPDAWRARARIAAALDFPHEAEEANRAAAGGASSSVLARPIEEPLPSVHLASTAPASFSDWAASLEITAGSLTAWGQDRAVVAVRSDVSGYSEDGVGLPVRLDLVLPGAFVLAGGQTFKLKGGSGWGGTLVVLGFINAALGAYTGSSEAMEVGQSSVEQGMDKISTAPKLLKGGAYKRGYWTGETFETIGEKGDPSGGGWAVGYPIVLPTASGSPFSEAVPMKLIEDGTKVSVPSIQVSRLLPSIGLSSLEAIVTSKELVTLLPKLDRARTSAFRGRASVAKAAADNFKRNGAGSLTFAEPRYAGRTPDGQCVDVTIGAQRWLIPEQ